jgi:hypothetical protein
MIFLMATDAPVNWSFAELTIDECKEDERRSKSDVPDEPECSWKRAG